MQFTVLIAIVFSLLLCSSSYGGQYFSCDEMDYFSTEKSCAAKKKQAKDNKPQKPDSRNNNNDEQGSYGFTKEQVELWAEPTVDESGKIVSKLPPLPALKVLVNPTEQSAKEYVEWNQKRMKALQNAQDLLKKASGADQLPGASVVDDIRKIKSVSFFFWTSCPYSEQQVPALEELAKKIGYSKFQAYITTNDTSKLNDFLLKTKMRIKVYNGQKAAVDNKITGVPVTIITMTDGRKLRFDGLTESFTEKRIDLTNYAVSPEQQALIGQQQPVNSVQQQGSCPVR